MTEQEMIARIKELELQVSRSKTSARIKVTEKGGVSFYGTGRFPITLYKSQWAILAENMPAIQEFIKANDHLLSQGKDDKKAAQSEAPKAQAATA
jgi:hypothetical protein